MKVEKYFKGYRMRKTEKTEVSYHYVDRNKNYGIGRTTLYLNGKHGAKEIEEFIKQKTGFKNIVLLNKFK